jgi:hypothetical protein
MLAVEPHSWQLADVCDALRLAKRRLLDAQW